MASPQAELNKLSDDELFDMGMFRCICGEAVYPTGDPQHKHCELDSK